MRQEARTRLRTATTWIVACAALFGVVGCDGSNVVGGKPDTGTEDTGPEDIKQIDTGTADTGAPDTGTADTGAPDTGTADTGVDAGPEDVVVDVPVDMGPPRCMTNADCAGNPSGTTCNAMTGMCQPPCTSNASCMGNPAGAICDMMSGLCTSRCTGHADCAGMMGGDICNPMTNMCTNRCTANGDCMGHPSGTTCNTMTGACVMPCRANADCAGNPSGAICDTMSGLCSMTCRSHTDCAGMMGTICNPMTRTCTNRCTANGDCMGHPGGAVCDTMSGRCVQCVASNDTCPPDQHCDPMSSACVPGCRADEGCLRPGEDGGMATQLRCNTMTRTCEQCVTDAHCPTGQRCSSNVCVAGCTDDSRCAMGERCCGGACVDPRTNDQNCGMCGTRCTAANGDPGCADGMCTIARCTAPFGDCDMTTSNGCETNTNTTVMHCGRCGNACPTPANAAPTCTTGTCGFTCNAGFADCNMDPSDGCETNTNTAPTSCGACGRACNVANGTAGCAAGACTVAVCNTGFANCDNNVANGCEVNTTNAVAHCGMCGRACATPANGTAACSGGTCGVGSCNAGFANCDMSAANGCEVNTTNTPAHCGACGRACAVANGTAGCAAGACTVAACNAGFADCDMNPANGCETNLNTTVGSCGMCGRACNVANGTAGCAAGACTVAACSAGFANCDMSAANGCEVNTRTDANHCNMCGNRCALPGGTNVCANGTCAVSMCAAGLGNCDGNAANGCETALATTLAHCGACGNACPTPANGTAACAAGTCGIGMCNAGFASCDMNAANGCETNLATDVNHCGACGQRCAARPNTVASCAARACTYACVAGFADCDMNPTNGCEVNLNTDTANCGTCRRTCAPATGGGASCTAGVCGQTCPTGQTNCSGTCRATATDVNNCGVCGRVCGFNNASATCAAGACVFGACNTGFGNCDNNPSNGCETDTRSTLAHCGTCGRACPVPPGGTATCTNSTCGVTCPTGLTNCSGTCRNLQTDRLACGSCGVACGTNQTCGDCGVCSCTNAVCRSGLSGSGSNGQSGSNCIQRFTFNVVSGRSYTITTLGSFSGDPYVVVSGACSCRNDDTCNLGAQCTCTATSTGTATICASTFSSRSATWNYVVRSCTSC